MKALLLTLLVTVLASGSLFTPAAAQEGRWQMCGYNETYSITTYYEYPGGPECGVTHNFVGGTPTTTTRVATLPTTPSGITTASANRHQD
jgi:hypothetical protein